MKASDLSDDQKNMHYSSWDSFAIKHQLLIFGWDTSLLPTWPGCGFEVEKVHKSVWVKLHKKITDGITGISRWPSGKLFLTILLLLC